MSDSVSEAREIVRVALGSTSTVVLAVLEAKADSWVHRLVPAIAAALQAAYAAGQAAERARLRNLVDAHAHALIADFKEPR